MPGEAGKQLLIGCVRLWIPVPGYINKGKILLCLEGKVGVWILCYDLFIDLLCLLILIILQIFLRLLKL
jgi:hypothetical protein